MLTVRVQCVGKNGIIKTGFPCRAASFAPQPGVEFDDPNLRNLVEEVSLKKVRVFNPGMDVNIIAFDCGMKANIIR